MMKKITKIAKIAGLLAIAISTSACVSSNQASQDAMTTARPLIYAEPVSQKFDQPYEQVAQLQISQQGAADLLAMSNLPVATKGVTQAGEGQQPVALVTKNSTETENFLVATAKPSYRISDVYVDVPAELVVSEANRFVPKGDIVWREDPIGDRKAQVKTILEDALRTGTAAIAGEKPAIMSVRLKMFHALSEKARLTVGGRHNIQFDYVLLDAETGKPVSEVKTVDAKFKALGGRKAEQAMRRGETQKVRISRYIADVVYQQLTDVADI